MQTTYHTLVVSHAEQEAILSGLLALRIVLSGKAATLDQLRTIHPCAGAAQGLTGAEVRELAAEIHLGNCGSHAEACDRVVARSRDLPHRLHG
jgi:hypothetical protein